VPNEVPGEGQNDPPMADENWILVASTREVKEAGGIFGRTVQGVPLAVFEVEGAYYVTSNRCTHGLARLSGGYLEGYLIECPVHQGRFDIRTGEVKGPPCTEPLPTFPVRHEGEAILVSAAALQTFQSRREDSKKKAT
jgi:naphthalene 1,2-dioxygenase ferredoxin component